MVGQMRTRPHLLASLVIATIVLAGLPNSGAAQVSGNQPLATSAALRVAVAPTAPDLPVTVAPPQFQAKSAGTAALFSLVLTGGGQFYNEDVGKGVVMLAAGIGFAAMAIDGINEYGCDATEKCYPWLLPTGLIGELAVKAWSIVDGVYGAQAYNQRHSIASLSLQPTFAVNPSSSKEFRIGFKGTF